MYTNTSKTTYLAKPGASRAVKRACSDNPRKVLTKSGLSLAASATVFTGNFTTSMGMLAAHGLFHQHVNAWPTSIFSLISFISTAVMAIAFDCNNKDLTRPYSPRNFAKQAVLLSSQNISLVSIKKDIKTNFETFAPDRVQSAQSIVTSTILEIEALTAEITKLNKKCQKTKTKNTTASTRLREVLLPKLDEAEATRQGLIDSLHTLRLQSHEAACATEIAKSVGLSLTPAAPKNPSLQLGEMNEWLSEYTQAYAEVGE